MFNKFNPIKSLLSMHPGHEHLPGRPIDIECFKLERVMGAGGFGVIRCATLKHDYNTPQKNDFYAVKEMEIARVFSRKDGLEEVMKEQHILSQIRHPFVCNLFYSFYSDTHCYLVMDFAYGGDLRYRIQNTAPNCLCKKKRDVEGLVMPEAELKFDVRCIVLALQYLHDEIGVIHRDIKPENLLIDAEGYILLTDFGVAEFLENGTCRKTSGTRQYMAPEVMKPNGTHSTPADIFSLGMTMFELISGGRIVQMTNIASPFALKKSQVDEMLLPRLGLLKEAGVSDSLCELLKQMLQFNPKNRIQSAADLMRDPWLSFEDNRDWVELKHKKLPPVFKPNATIAHVDKNLAYIDLMESLGTARKPDPVPKEYLSMFEGFYYDYQNGSGNGYVSKTTKGTNSSFIATSTEKSDGSFSTDI